MIKANAAYFCMLGIATAICVVFLLPFMIDTGHKLLAIPMFAVLVMAAIYGRCNPIPVRRKRSVRSE
jgi:hypothetical protein